MNSWKPCKCWQIHNIISITLCNNAYNPIWLHVGPTWKTCPHLGSEQLIGLPYLLWLHANRGNTFSQSSYLLYSYTLQLSCLVLIGLMKSFVSFVVLNQYYLAYKLKRNSFSHICLTSRSTSCNLYQWLVFYLVPSSFI